MKHSTLSLFLSLSTALFIYPLSLIAEPSTISHSGIISEYDKTADTVSVNASDASLKAILREIAKHSSLEVLFDDGAEENISITFNKLPIAKAIENLLRGKNYLVQYSNTQNHTPTLTSIIVLPKGQSDSKNAKRLNSLQNEAFYKASQNLTLDQVNEIDRSLDRWQARINRLTPEKRQELETRAKKRVIARQSAKEHHNKRREEQKQQDEIQAQLEAENRQQHNLDLTEEEIAISDQRAQQSRDQMRSQILQHLNSVSAQ